MVFGRNVTSQHPLRISLGNGIYIGDHAFEKNGTMLVSLDDIIDIAAGAGAGCYCRIGSARKTTICRKDLLASYVYVVGADHGTSRTDIPVTVQPNVSLGGAIIG
jgi:hypothetical protein|tara:strand:- start:1248 stop:1562 length:315 start_codon:yes stop_codon:yes gene_type:complete